MTQVVTARSQHLWILSLYALEGLFFALVTSVSLIIYKNFNFSNSKITFFTSLFAIPWLLKPIVAPIIGNLATKRNFILLMPVLIMMVMLVLILCLFQSNFFYSSIVLFFMMGLMSSIFDLNVDGYYITQLTYHDQARYIGIRSTCYQIGRLTCQGAIVFIASLLMHSMGVRASWQVGLLILAGIVLAFAVYHCKVLSDNSSAMQQKLKNTAIIYSTVYNEFIKLPYLLLMAFFFIIYSIAENQLIKVVPLFLLDHVSNGGLGLNLTDIAVIIGIIGLISLLVGIILSGFILARLVLEVCLIPITLFLVFADTGYILLSVTGSHNLALISVVVALAQFGFGLSNGIYMLYLLRYFGQGPHSMSLYAIGTALMGFSVVVGGAISGYIQSLLGYRNFFIWIVLINAAITIFCFYIVKLKWIAHETIAN